MLGDYSNIVTYSTPNSTFAYGYQSRHAAPKPTRFVYVTLHQSEIEAEEEVSDLTTCRLLFKVLSEDLIAAEELLSLQIVRSELVKADLKWLKKRTLRDIIIR